MSRFLALCDDNQGNQKAVVPKSTECYRDVNLILCQPEGCLQRGVHHNLHADGPRSGWVGAGWGVGWGAGGGGEGSGGGGEWGGGGGGGGRVLLIIVMVLVPKRVGNTLFGSVVGCYC